MAVVVPGQEKTGPGSRNTNKYLWLNRMVEFSLIVKFLYDLLSGSYGMIRRFPGGSENIGSGL